MQDAASASERAATRTHAAGSGSRAAAVEAGYACWMWLDARVGTFPVAARRQMGHRLLDAVLDALTATVEAAYLKPGGRRVGCLELANRRLALARLLLRGARERRYVSIAQHEHAIGLVDVWGRQLGGWLRAERARASRAPGCAAR
jgi:hypothetical protein